jgi:folate-binding Fe-S cluster repair protein YgfZ
MQYKGKLKKHMYHIYLDKDLLLPGDDLYSENGQQSIGKIVNIVNIDNQGSEALAVITEKHVTNNDVFTHTDKKSTDRSTEGGNESGIRNAKILTLPYAI